MTRGNEKAGGTAMFATEAGLIDKRALYGGAALVIVAAAVGAAIALGVAIAGTHSTLAVMVAADLGLVPMASA